MSNIRPQDYLTATDIYRFFQCPHWPYYERFATPEEQKRRRAFTSAEMQRMEHGVAHEKEVIARLMVGKTVAESTRTGDVLQDAETTKALMAEGAALIYQGTLTHGEWTGRPDVLERREGKSVFGPWMYVPVDIKSNHVLEKYQKMQLMFYATLLEKIQGTLPAELAIINVDGERTIFLAEELIAEFRVCIEALERVRAGERPDPVLRKSCYDVGPWGAVCEHLARSTNDVALLFNVDVPKLRALRSLGLRTIDDVAEMDPQAFDGVAKGLRLHGLEVMKRQAQSLRSGKVMVREAITLPAYPLEIHFDIESDPPNDTDYLYGILIRHLDTGVEEYCPHVAKTLADEEQMWRGFLAWIETLPPQYVVYHFSPYEMNRLELLERRYGGSPWLDLFRQNMIDLKELVSHAITFPLYFYGLKYIAPFLGFAWSGDVTGGSQSVDVFESYIKTGNEALLQSLLQYNEDDVRATAFLTDWLKTYAREITTYDAPYPWRGGSPD